MKNLIVIPARLASTRLPKKLLLSETGKPLIQHTYEAACQSRLADSVLVAADDPQMLQTVQSFGGRACLTSETHPSGTDRLAEVARQHPHVEIFVNVQGDEPEIHFADIDRLITTLQENSGVDMATLATPIRDAARLRDPACVKVVFDQHRRALYFSRSPIPFTGEELADLLPNEPPLFHQHVGVYAYRRDWLLQLASLPPSTYEIAESLEQLRALQHGQLIMVEITEHDYRGIDTAADYAAFVSRQRS